MRKPSDCIDYHLVFRIIATDPSPGEALRSFVAQEIEAAGARAPVEPDAGEREHEHEHVWERRQNVTTKGSVMPAIEVCGCGAARHADAPVSRTPDAHLAAAKAEGAAEAFAAVLEAADEGNEFGPDNMILLLRIVNRARVAHRGSE